MKKITFLVCFAATFLNSAFCVTTVTTVAAFNIQQHTAMAGGTVQTSYGTTITSRGLCWSSSNQNPTIADPKSVDGNGTGNFTGTMTGLTASYYYYRAYAIANSVAVYGPVMIVNPLHAPEVMTQAPIQIYPPTINYNYATVGGIVMWNGGLPIIERGLCWSIYPAIPDINSATKYIDSKKELGQYTYTLQNLIPNTRYNVRAYASNSLGLTYGSVIDFTTLSLSITSSIIDQLNNTTTIQTNIVSQAGASITHKGVCWSTNPGPTYNLSTKTDDGSGVGGFTSIISNLAPDTKYYIRGYTNNSYGTVYGNELELTLTRFPLTIRNGKFYDGFGNPFLIVGDSPWYLITELTVDNDAIEDNCEVDKYLTDRKNTKVNAIIINIIDRNKTFFDDGHLRPRNHYDELPFNCSFGVDEKGFPIYNFDTLADNNLNRNYFDKVEYVIKKALNKGIVVFLFPAYLGYDGEHDDGWYKDLIYVNNSEDNAQHIYGYGKFLGSRYKKYKNIIWMMGGDYRPNQAINPINRLVDGINDGSGNNQLFSVHNARGESGVSQYNWPASNGWIDFNTTYGGFQNGSDNTVSLLNADYSTLDNQSVRMPFIFFEGNYESDPTRQPGEIQAIPFSTYRAQMYRPILMGAMGYFFGNYDLFQFKPDWNPGFLNTNGADDLKRSSEFFNSNRWKDLKPDNTHSFLTSETVFDKDYAPAAVTDDGNLAVIYEPFYRASTVKIKAGSTISQVKWFDPSVNVITPVDITYPDISNPNSVPIITQHHFDNDCLVVIEGTNLKSTLNKEREPISTISNERKFFYPNPASDHLYFSGTLSEKSIISIFDINGNLTVNQNGNNKKIDISSLASGVYFIKIINEGTVMTEKFIKQ